MKSKMGENLLAKTSIGLLVVLDTTERSISFLNTLNVDHAI